MIEYQAPSHAETWYETARGGTRSIRGHLWSPTVLSGPWFLAVWLRAHSSDPDVQGGVLTAPGGGR